MKKPAAPIAISNATARRIWLRAQRLDRRAPFGDGPDATVAAAVAHLGYVQIDTINVIERCHHHILFSRHPRPTGATTCGTAQSVDKTRVRILDPCARPMCRRAISVSSSRTMKPYRRERDGWFCAVKPEDTAQGDAADPAGTVALSIRDIDDDVLRREGPRMGQPQAVEAGVATRLLRTAR